MKSGDDDAGDAGERITARLEAVLGVPFTSGNGVRVLRNGERIFPAMLEAIAGAEHSLEFLTFVYWTGTVAERFAGALAARARAGVRVRVLLDGYGARPMRRDWVEEMTAAGVDVRWFRPLATVRFWRNAHRTHRKILVADGRLGFTGGVGIAEEWEGDARNPSEWRDTHFEVRGPAVDGLRAAFFGNWAETARESLLGNFLTPEQPQAGPARIQVVRSTAGIGWSDVAILLDSLIALAEKRIRIGTAYFSPDEVWVEAFRRAIARGVRVEVLIPGPHVDKRLSELAGAEAIEALLTLGVEIHRFQPSMLHTKIVLVDDCVACVGSPNFNQRSLTKDDEVAMVVIDPEVVRTLNDDYDADLQRSERVKGAAFRKRDLARRALERLVRPIRGHV